MSDDALRAALTDEEWADVVDVYGSFGSRLVSDRLEAALASPQPETLDVERLAEANHAIARCGVGAVTGPHGLEDCPYRHLFDRNAEAIAREYDRLGSET